MILKWRFFFLILENLKKEEKDTAQKKKINKQTI